MPQSFRVTVDHDEKIKQFNEKGQFYIVKESDKEKIHYHGICYEEVTRQTLRNWILTIFKDEAYEVTTYTTQIDQVEKEEKKCKGNKFYSIKDDIGDIEAAERYLSKGTGRDDYAVIVNNRGVDSKQRNAEYWDVNDASVSARRIKCEAAKSHKKEFKEYVISNYKLGSYGNKLSIEFLISLYYHYVVEHDIEPTPRASGQTMFKYLLAVCNEVGSKEVIQDFVSFYQ